MDPRGGRARSAIRVQLAVTAGALMLLSMPPGGWWFFFPPAVALLAFAVNGAGWRVRLLVGLAAGAILLAPGLFWLTSFNAAGYVAVLVVEVLLFAGAMVVVPGRHGGWWTLPAALVLLEAVRGRFPFGGFPMPGLALGQVDGPFAVAAGLGGSLLVVGVAAGAGVVFAAPFLAARRVFTPVGVAIAVVVVLAISMLQFTTDSRRFDVALVQGGGPRGIPAIESDPSLVPKRHFAATSRISGSPDLVLWPEGVVSVDGPVTRTAEGERLAALARRLDTTLVVGVVEGEGRRFRNAAVAWGPDRALDRYEKVHRVPFGEYIPFRGLVERFSDDARFVPRDAIPGKGAGVLETPDGPVGVVISYEVFFSDRARAAVDDGRSGLLLVPTNAASYTTEEVPAMEVATARLRARELGRTVLQAAPTGYSAVILPDGKVIRQSELEEADVLRARVPLRTGSTPYTRTGDWPALVLAIAMVVTSAVTGVRGGRSRP